MVNLDSTNWEQLLVEINDQFSNDQEDDVVDALNKIQQLGRVEEYISKFQSLKSRVMHINPYFPDSYYVSSFLSGLQPDIKQWVKIHKTNDLKELYKLAKHHEKATELTIQRAKSSTIPSLLSTIQDHLNHWKSRKVPI